MLIKLDIPARRIADLMTTAIEGDYSRYWCSGVYWQSRAHDPIEGANKTPWYADPATYERPDFGIAIHELDEQTGDETIHMVDAEALASGVAKMAEIAGAAFGDFMREDGDGITADCFLQAIALGEIRYG